MKYKHHNNNKRRIIYWLERHNLDWVAHVVSKVKKGR